jgi:hypothetical protein
MYTVRPEFISGDPNNPFTNQ